MSPPPEAVIAIGNIPLPSSSTHENELVGNEIVVSNDPALSELRAETPDLSTPTTFLPNPAEFIAEIVISELGVNPDPIRCISTFLAFLLHSTVLDPLDPTAINPDVDPALPSLPAGPGTPAVSYTHLTLPTTPYV